MTKSFLSRVERDITSPSVASLVGICDALGLSLAELFQIPQTTLVRRADRPSLDDLPKAAEVCDTLITPAGERHVTVLETAASAGGSGGVGALHPAQRVRGLLRARGRRSRSRWRTGRSRSARATRSPSAPPSRTRWRAVGDGARILWILAPALPDPQRSVAMTTSATRFSRRTPASPRATPASARSPALPHVDDPARGRRRRGRSACPFDTATSMRPGARFGPAGDPRRPRLLLRPYNPAQDVDVFGTLSVVDRGDLEITPGNAQRTAEQIAAQLEPVLRAGDRAAGARRRPLDRARRAARARRGARAGRASSCSTPTPTRGSSTTASATSTARRSSARSRRG